MGAVSHRIRVPLLAVFRWCWYTVGILLILFALVISLAQYYFPRLSDYQSQLISEVNSRTPFGVAASRLTAEWTGLAPTIFARDLRLFDRAEPQNVLVSVAAAEIRIDLIQSLVSQEVRVRKLIVENADIRLNEDENGNWTLVKTESEHQRGISEFLLGLVLGVREVEFIGSRVSLDFQHKPDLIDATASLRLENFKGFRRLRVAIDAAAERQSLNLLLEAKGNLRESNRFSLEGYLELEAVSTERFESMLQNLGLRLSPTRLSGSLWLSRTPDAQMVIQGELHSPSLVWNYDRGKLRTELTDVALDAQMRLLPGRSIEVSVAELQAQWLGQTLTFDDLSMVRELSHSGGPLHVAMSTLDVGPLIQALRKSPLLSDRLASTISILNPRGLLRNLSITVPVTSDDRERFALSATLDDVQVSPWQGAPGAKGVRGYLSLGARSGFVELDSDHLQLNFARVFDHSMDFSSGRGRVDWAIGDSGIRVWSQLLHLHGDKGRVRGHFLLDMPSDPSVADTLSILASLTKANAQDYRYFLPRRIDASLEQWLGSAVRGGQVQEAGFHLHMPVSRPRPPKAFDLQLVIDIVDGKLKFDPNWPALNDLAGTLYVDNASNIRAHLADGTILGNRFDQFVVSVVRPEGSEARRLGFAGTIASDLSSAVNLFKQTPLKNLVNDRLSDWNVGGKLHARVSADLPLRTDLAADVDAHVAVAAVISDGRLELPRWRLALDNIDGSLRFDMAGGLRSRALSASLWGKSITGRLGVVDPLAQDKGVSLDLTGAVDVVQLAEWLRQPVLHMARGVTPVHARIELESDSTRLAARSDLVGVEFRAPAPFDKSAEEELPLEARYELIGDESRTELILADTAAAVISLGSTEDSTRVGIQIDAKPQLPELPSNGLQLNGRLVRADLGEWLSTIGQYLTLSGQYPKPALSIEANLEILDLSANQLSLPDVVLKIRRDAPETRVDVLHPALQGTFRINDDPTLPLIVRLEELKLEAFLDRATETGETAAVEVPKTLAGIELPDAELTIDSLTRSDEDLGSWAFSLQRLPQGLRIKNLKGTLRGLEITGREPDEGASLVWDWEDPGVSTGFDGAVSSHRIDAALKALHLPALAEAKKTRVTVGFQWPGAPQDFDVSQLTGWGRFELRDGRLLDVENSPGLRIMGVLNLNEIVRRLQFNFEDFFKKGLTFDRFSGHLAFEPGLLTIMDAIELKGPSTRFNLTGGADLRSDRINAELVATLPLGSNLPWVAAMAGGPAVAAGVFVASKIFENQVGKLSSAVYSVTGPIDDPEVTLVKVFDTGDGDAEHKDASPASDNESAEIGKREPG